MKCISFCLSLSFVLVGLAAGAELSHSNQFVNISDSNKDEHRPRSHRSHKRRSNNKSDLSLSEYSNTSSRSLRHSSRNTKYSFDVSDLPEKQDTISKLAESEEFRGLAKLAVAMGTEVLLSRLSSKEKISQPAFTQPSGCVHCYSYYY